MNWEKTWTKKWFDDETWRSILFTLCHTLWLCFEQIEFFLESQMLEVKTTR